MTTPLKGSLCGALFALAVLLPGAPAQQQPPLDSSNALPPNTLPPSAPSPGEIVGKISFAGLRRVPQDTVRAELSTKEGDRYDAAALDRDLSTLQNTGRFEGVRWEREASQTGWNVRFTVVERRVQAAAIVPARPVPQSEVLDRFQMR